MWRSPGGRSRAITRRERKCRSSSTPVEPQIDGPRSPMVFDVTMGVRKGDDALRDDDKPSHQPTYGRISIASSPLMACRGSMTCDQAQGAGAMRASLAR